MRLFSTYAYFLNPSVDLKFNVNIDIGIEGCKYAG